MEKAITIEVLRISSNGQHLEFIISCPSDYQFTEFTVQIDGRGDKYSIAKSLFYDETTGDYIVNPDNKFIGQVPVELFDVTGPEIYHIYIKAEHQLHADPEGVEKCEKAPDVIESESWISDVSQVYYCLMDDILAFDTKCADKDIQDRVIRNYLILCAHEEALKLGLLDEAKKWFQMMENCFTGRCKHSIDRNNNSGCGCGSVRHEHHHHHSGCGCCGK